MKGTDEVIKNVKKFVGEREVQAEALGSYYATKMENYAKQNAPWEDRTSHARQGLQGDYYIHKNAIMIRVAHTMEYGVFLELAMQGKYAILQPTVAHFQDDFFADIEKLVKG